jgi:hypothetical protein
VGGDGAAGRFGFGFGFGFGLDMLNFPGEEVISYKW